MNSTTRSILSSFHNLRTTKACHRTLLRMQSTLVRPSKHTQEENSNTGRDYSNHNTCEIHRSQTNQRSNKNLLTPQSKTSSPKVAQPTPRDASVNSNKICGRTSCNGNHVTSLKDYDSDLIVVLDMDECLIHSQFLNHPSNSKSLAHQVSRGTASSAYPDNDLENNVIDMFDTMLSNGDLVRVFQRPHLQDFLREVTSRFETHIFTASMELYAKPVLEVLDPHGDFFTHCWYRDSCLLDPNVGAYVKSLENVWGDNRMKRTVLVDNNPMSFLANPENGILVSSFYDDPEDRALPAVLNLLEELDGEEDVRPILNARFGLRQAMDDIVLQQHLHQQKLNQLHQQISQKQHNQQRTPMSLYENNIPTSHEDGEQELMMAAAASASY